jgi:hypothetical protein
VETLAMQVRCEGTRKEMKEEREVNEKRDERGKR